MPNKRMALVIGNADYQHATRLDTPVRDALTVADALERLDFNVKLAQNCDISDFQSELDNFVQHINGADAALFYYSGHALQYGGDNYLIPVDTRLQAAKGLDRLTFRLTPLLEEMRSNAGVSLVFLDACRDNPFELDPKGPAPGTKRVVINPSGLTEIPKAALKEALIAFAAEQGKTADDGEEGGLSPFTWALCEHIEKPGLAVTRMMQLVRKSVREATDGRQTPWSNESLTNDFYFKPADGAVQPLEPILDVVDRVGEELPKLDVEPPRKPEHPALGVSARLPNLAAGIEAVAKSLGPFPLAGLSMAVMFSLLLMSQAFNLNWIELPGSRKEVGFMAAPNWSIVYFILFPFYLVLFGVLTDRVRIMLIGLLNRRFIHGPQGEPIAEDRLFAAWREALQKISLVLWGMLAFIALQTSVEWLTTCLMPYYGGPAVVIDWTTSAIHGSELERARSIVFSAAAYLYMAVALYVYLAILVYAATVCYFLNTLADPTGEFRLVLRDGTLGEQFSFIGIIIYWSVMLGLGAGFMMRLQAVYLASGHLIVTDLLFNDVWNWLGRPPPTSAAAAGGTVPSAWTGMAEMIFTLLSLFACCLFLYNAFERAKQYYSDNVGDQKWRKAMKVDHSKEETDALRRQPFLKTVFPMYVHFGFLVAGVVASGVFIGNGVVPLVTLAYFVVVFMILPGFRGDGGRIAN